MCGKQADAALDRRAVKHGFRAAHHFTVREYSDHLPAGQPAQALANRRQGAARAVHLEGAAVLQDEAHEPLLIEFLPRNPTDLPLHHRACDDGIQMAEVAHRDQRAALQAGVFHAVGADAHGEPEGDPPRNPCERIEPARFLGPGIMGRAGGLLAHVGMSGKTQLTGYPAGGKTHFLERLAMAPIPPAYPCPMIN